MLQEQYYEYANMETKTTTAPQSKTNHYAVKDSHGISPEFY